MSSGNPEILVINLGIDDQKVARFSLRLRDNPTLRVRDFCQIHSLPDQIEQQLVKHVLESREGAIRSLHEQTQAISNDEDPFLQAIDQQIRDAEKALVGQASKSSSSRNSLQKLQSPPKKSSPTSERRPASNSKQNKWQNKAQQGKHSPIKEAAQEHEERDRSGETSRDEDQYQHRDTSPADDARMVQGSNSQRGPGPQASQRSSRRGSNIHSRLYYEGLRKMAYHDQLSTQKKLQESLELQESQIGRDRHCSPRDVVSRLYYNGVKHMAIKHLEREKIKTQELSKELEGCTYTPAVSEVSKQLAQVRMQRGPQPLEDALIREGLEFAHRREQAAAYKTAQELSHLRDKPETNPTSIAIAKERSRLEGKDRVSCHEALFEDSYIRRNRTLMETEGLLPKPECTFQPLIDPYSAELVRQKRGDCSVMERMAKYAAEKDQRLQENLTRKAITETMIDAETEQALFRPITGRAPASRNTNGLEVGTFLHNISYQRAHKQKQVADSVYDRKKTEVGANPQSAELVESRKLLLFRQLFEKLDSDGDGAISPDKVDVDAVEAAVLKYLAPLLINMDEIGAVLDEHTFVDAMDQVYKSLSIAERQHLMSFGKQKSNQSKYEEPSFTPALCPKSLEIAHIKGRRSLVETASLAAKFAVRKKRAGWEAGEEEDAGSLLFATADANGDQERPTQSHQQSRSQASHDQPTFQPQLTQYRAVTSHYV